MFKLEEFKQLVKDFAAVADFLVVYIAEAHSTGQWDLTPGVCWGFCFFKGGRGVSQTLLRKNKQSQGPFWMTIIGLHCVLKISDMNFPYSCIPKGQKSDMGFVFVCFLSLSIYLIKYDMKYEHFSFDCFLLKKYKQKKNNTKMLLCLCCCLALAKPVSRIVTHVIPPLFLPARWLGLHQQHRHQPAPEPGGPAVRGSDPGEEKTPVPGGGGRHERHQRHQVRRPAREAIRAAGRESDLQGEGQACPSPPELLPAGPLQR